MGLNPTGCWAFFSSLLFSFLSTVHPLSGPLQRCNITDFPIKYALPCSLMRNKLNTKGVRKNGLYFTKRSQHTFKGHLKLRFTGEQTPERVFPKRISDQTFQLFCCCQWEKTFFFDAEIRHPSHRSRASVRFQRLRQESSTSGSRVSGRNPGCCDRMGPHVRRLINFLMCDWQYGCYIS